MCVALIHCTSCSKIATSSNLPVTQEMMGADGCLSMR